LRRAPRPPPAAPRRARRRRVRHLARLRPQQGAAAGAAGTLHTHTHTHTNTRTHALASQHAHTQHAQEERRLQALLRAAPSYEAWSTLAAQLAASERKAAALRDAGSLLPWRRARARRLSASGAQRDPWGAFSSRQPYDTELVEERLRLLRASRASGDVGEMMFALRADLLRSLGNVTNLGRRLHEPEHVGVPPLVAEYIAEVRTQLRHVAAESDLRSEEKLAFLQETRHCFGRTALLLSGGGTLGAFHIGVVRALVRSRLLPRVLAGSSVGSVVASIIATRTADELRELFHDEASFRAFLPDMTFFSGATLGESVSNYVRTGALHDIAFFQTRLRAILGDITFQDAYDRSGGRILCVAVCATRGGERPRLLNYLTAPHLVIWSAVAASCAFPNLFPPQPLLGKSRGGALVAWQPEGRAGPRLWRDGSLEEDLPMRGLSELFNVNYFIVSQTNPHIVPILRAKRALAKRSAAWAAAAAFAESEWKHRCRQVRELAPWADPFDVAALFGQQWEGDVTVVMPFTAAQLSRVVSNPDSDYLLATALQGEREMWPKLATIDANCGIEMQLDECARELRARLHRSVSLARRGRVVRAWAEWVHVCAFALTHVCLFAFLPPRSRRGTPSVASRTSCWAAATRWGAPR
jgi:TAG lipase/steryl ester hydrolase/phospholipase A2/LPA acyltransferase